MTLRLVFMGTPEFAVPTLARLLAAGHELLAVYSQPPRPAGRGHRVQLSPVHAFAAERGLPVRTPATLKDPAAQEAFHDLNADLAVVVAYGLLLPAPVLRAPRLGCVNLHGSILPRWRGAAPIQRAILAGDAETGVAVMLMDEGLDTGPVLALRRVPIAARTTAAELVGQLASLGADLMAAAIDDYAAGRLVPQAQPSAGVTYARKIGKDEGRIDWRRPATEIDRLVRALGGAPGVWFEHRGERVKVLEAIPEVGSGGPGDVLDDRILVACGSGALRLLRLQRPGRGALDAADFLRGYALAPGDRLG